MCLNFLVLNPRQTKGIHSPFDKLTIAECDLCCSVSRRTTTGTVQFVCHSSEDSNKPLNKSDLTMTDFIGACPTQFSFPGCLTNVI